MIGGGWLFFTTAANPSAGSPDLLLISEIH